jgi:hypothetical protein
MDTYIPGKRRKATKRCRPDLPQAKPAQCKHTSPHADESEMTGAASRRHQLDRRKSHASEGNQSDPRDKGTRTRLRAREI